MKLGELPKGMVRMVIPQEDTSFVRFTCSECQWTTAFTTTPEGAVTITPEHYCPVREGGRRLVIDPECIVPHQNPLLEYLKRTSGGPGPEVM